MKHSVENNKACSEFVRKTNTLMPKEGNLELNLYRLIGAIFEEFSEYKEEADDKKSEEEMRDCQYYLISLYNFISDIEPNKVSSRIFGDTTTSFSKRTTISAFLGIIKKRVRKNKVLVLDDEMQEHLNDLKNYLYDVLFNFKNPIPFEYTNNYLILDKYFVKELTKKFIIRFPEHCCEWEIYPELHTHVFNNLPKKYVYLFNKQVNKGLEKYGTYLDPFNKRDCLEDLKEEMMDALMYYAQAQLENKESDAFYIIEEFYKIACGMKKYMGVK